MEFIVEGLDIRPQSAVTEHIEGDRPVQAVQSTGNKQFLFCISWLWSSQIKMLLRQDMRDPHRGQANTKGFWAHAADAFLAAQKKPASKGWRAERTSDSVQLERNLSTEEDSASRSSSEAWIGESAKG